MISKLTIYHSDNQGLRAVVGLGLGGPEARQKRGPP